MDEKIEAAQSWRELVHGTSGWWSGDPVVKAAYEDPTLRTLFPFPTHGTLKFFRYARQPYPAVPREELPFIVCGGPPYRVFTPGYEQLVGEATTAVEAVELVVASLPDPAPGESEH
ncbi:DUF6193 family natural product biosynthesis protein [Micromonospora lupini]|uniref:Uncharacterized protein n=1 Tax=Micromonospora lupini str. Lupac 08 TaxID=1150864 RepID=I0L5L0_9ACTN|nr:DUF6193 family natural product biosynthesis protein [Micromonospora lupini]CCH19107.1 Conserved hypothetical protein [Micromonospora lupini str. Lupac 08]